MSANTYDAIVIGSGISGGWAAKELTEKGLKTIMLERGRNIEHIKDYVNANKDPWDFPHLSLIHIFGARYPLPPSTKRGTIIKLAAATALVFKNSRLDGLI